jgi:hypothetical protein
MIGLETARELLDFGARIDSEKLAEDQLIDAVAVHNLLERESVVYLANEVGTGKTVVALGAWALFQHFDPNFRVLVIAPRENIQMKWIKELRNFVASNVRFPDLRVKSLDGQPARQLVACHNLLDFMHEVVLNRDRDFFLRLSSFSLPTKGGDELDREKTKGLRRALRRHLPWLADEIFDLRNKQEFKDHVACALCCALPVFDLVIVDEGHNLKHGFGTDVSARNRVLALAFGRREAKEVDPRLRSHYGLRAKRLLLLSATPVEESYEQLWNQLDVFKLGDRFQALNCSDADEDRKKAEAAKFLLRRVTTVRVGDADLTKNQYRREWRRGGVSVYDEPIQVDDPRQRLAVALVQKKVSELLQNDRFGSAFQIGMLASFESFLETAKTKRGDDETANFDDPDQVRTADSDLEREGIDVADVNRVAKSYRDRFQKELPHPKMDALVEALASSWQTGNKALVFVRRIASVTDLKRKLDERYDKWLIARLRSELPEQVRQRFEEVVDNYYRERLTEQAAMRPTESEAADDESPVAKDRGGTDSFFAWFFRGDGPAKIISGANIQRRFVQRGATYSTFFEDNYVAEIIGSMPGGVESSLAAVLGVDGETLRAELRQRSAKFLSLDAKKHAQADRFEAVQAAAVKWLTEHEGAYQDRARIVWHERFESAVRNPHAAVAPDIGDWLELRTYFTEIRQRPNLRRRLWPTSKTRRQNPATGNDGAREDQLEWFAEPTRELQVSKFRTRELRAQMLAAAARLGHAFIDLYVMTIRRLGSLDLRAQEQTDATRADAQVERIGEYLDLLEDQMQVPRQERDWRAFDELADLAENFDLILDVNAPEVRTQPLSRTVRTFGTLFGTQQPVGGMSGQINRTLVRQFRLPGYPLVLVSTDLLQEGEDLHTFCSGVHHYGISWTSSAMEQRIGRIDRVCSQTDRRLSNLTRELRAEDKLQVYFPYLEDTVEVLQVRRILERMNTFLRLMHEGLTPAASESSKIRTDRDFVRSQPLVPQIQERLQTAFPVPKDILRGDVTALAVTRDVAERIGERFANLRSQTLPDLSVAWEPPATPGILLGTASLGARRQPFRLQLCSLGSRPLVRCLSPVGRIFQDEQTRMQNEQRLLDFAARYPMRISVTPGRQQDSFDLAVVDDVLLADDVATDALRVAILVRRVVQHADFLEQQFLPGNDARLDEFRPHLVKEIQDDA